MPLYRYRAKNQKAETVAGQIHAESREDAVDKINQMGLIPAMVEEQKHAVTNKGVVRPQKVRSKEIYTFSRQLVSLIRAGVPILRALEIISAQTKNLYFRDVIDSVQSAVRGGKNLSDSLANYPKIFSSLYITMTKAGEESGRLKETVSSMAEYQRQQEEISSKVRTAIAYPILMATFGVVTIVFVLTYVMPKITVLYANLNQALPTPTVIVMTISSFLVHRGLWALVGVLFVILLIKQWIKTPGGQIAISQVKLKTPFFGPFLVKIEIARFAEAMRLLMQSGVSIVRAIQLSIPVVDNPLIRSQLKICQDELISGRSFGQSLKKSSIIPDMVGHLISVGEESGSLTGTLTDISTDYYQETNEKIKMMTTLLEPLMIIFVGSIIGFIVVAMLLPIFQLDVFAQ